MYEGVPIFWLKLFKGVPIRFKRAFKMGFPSVLKVFKRVLSFLLRLFKGGGLALSFLFGRITLARAEHKNRRPDNSPCLE